ncbi:MAG: cytochrome c oxidase subunit II transmembrane domain-containing protein, partial [Staphylococcus simulans]|nr:cytochrome c oxidase subunit II transmembrane domain-containing protein [Staphylococcus simulans]
MSKIKSLLLLFGSLILLSGCEHMEVLNPKGPMASSLKWLIIYSIIFMLVIVAVVFILFAVFAYKYRYTNTTQSGKVHHSALLETIWFTVPF